MKPETVLVAVSDVRVPEERKRRLQPRVVDELVESIRAVGMLNPIILRADNALIAGLHRFEAAKKIGAKFITAKKVKGIDDLRVELVEIDENLVRAELTAMERGEQLRRRKELYEAIHPEAKHGGAPAKKGGEGGKVAKVGHSAPSFADDTAKKTGASARTVRRQVAVAERISAPAREKLRGTPAADSQAQLEDLAKESPERQEAIADRLASKQAKSVGEAKAQLPATDDGPKDGLGLDIPPALRSAWGGISRAVEAIDAHLRAAQAEWTKAEKGLEDQVTKSRLVAKFLVEGRALLKGATGDVIRDFSGRLRELAPYAVCLNCNGAGFCPGKTCKRIRLAGEGKGTCNCPSKLCGACEGTGVVTRKHKTATEREARG